MKKFYTAAIAAVSIALVGCGGGGGGTAHNPETGQTVQCTASVNGGDVSLSCDGQNINPSMITNAVEQEDGTYLITYNGAEWIVSVPNYTSGLVADLIVAHMNGINGEGVRIHAIDGGDHGDHVGGIIESVAPGASVTVTYNANTNQADIFNHSYGGYETGYGNQRNDDGSYTYRTTYETAAASHGAFFDGIEADNKVSVIAAGNHYDSGATGATRARSNQIAVVAYDRAQQNILVVGALNDAGTAIASYSTRAGVLKDRYITTIAPRDLRNNPGTSYAAPIVAGVVGLIMDNRGDRDGRAATNRILITADGGGSCRGNVESITGRYCADNTYGRGRLNVGRALSPVGGLR